MNSAKAMVHRLQKLGAASASLGSEATVGGRWALAMLVLMAGVGTITWVYRETAWSIVEIWLRSDTYAHGFLIVPISLWLIWEKRAGLRQLSPSPVVSPLGLLLLLGATWLLAAYVDVLVVQQYAYVGMIVVTALSILGNQAGRYLAFPIFFLFFAVPAGERLVYPMMNFTADFTVGMLEVTGIPVYREGLFFTIPSGRWSVVEACSGVRYLIASVTLGVLFAYLSFSHLWKRLLFIFAATVLPIVGNGLRAYVIVMIGHLSDMKLAVGVDHLIYGWVFFGILMAILFTVGSFWRDPAPTLSTTASRAVASAAAGKFGAVVVLSIALSGIWPLLLMATGDKDRGERTVVVSVPEESEQWTISEDAAWDWRPHVFGADGSIYTFYRDGRDVVGLYMGVYRSQRQGAELVSSRNVMVPQKHPMWSSHVFRPHAGHVSGFGRLHVERHLLSSRQGQRLVVWTWYRVFGTHTANPYLAKLAEAASVVLRGGGDSALIAVAAEYQEKPEDADSAIQRFLAAMLPGIEAGVENACCLE